MHSLETYAEGDNGEEIRIKLEYQVYPEDENGPETLEIESIYEWVCCAAINPKSLDYDNYEWVDAWDKYCDIPYFDQFYNECCDHHAGINRIYF